MEIRILENKSAVARAFANHFANIVRDKLSFNVALSGGSTPKVVFDLLADEYHDLIDWSKIHFYWGDERCVPPADAQSNYKMTNEHLFSKIDIYEDNIHRILGENEPREEAKRYSDVLGTHLKLEDGIPRFDLVILGMGDDGHTASIFPHEIELWSDAKSCVVATHPESGQKRVSITGNIINAAEEVIFLVTGENKAEKIKEIHTKADGYKQYPAALVNPESGKLTWFLDQAAASTVCKLT